MDEQEKKKSIDYWYAAFDLPDEELKVFTDKEHEEKVRLRLLSRIISNIPETSQSPGIFLLQPANWIKIAAVLTFFICSVPLYQYLVNRNAHQTKNDLTWSISKVATGKMLKVILSDGSEILLNSGSELKYPRHFTGTKREIYLNGEAFFKVAHNPDKPFVVTTRKLQTTVLGTSFNIRAYSAMDQVVVNVATGKVGISASGKTLAALLPNQQITFQVASGAYQVKEFNAQMAHSWQNGSIRLDGASFRELALVIKNTWGLTLETKSERLATASYKTTFQTNNQITEVMKAISKMTDAKYRIRDHIITLYE
ncbi:FecR family protein [Pedobacter steynii]|uniref:Uncharacterized protein n=1 Tax=Pedobacter steynii TaxID=430522 RepID=A0A1D7QL53_9SPHI|nr:FecR family protein [Pedobacter steynii]AOM79380.1 hypothetical protein BFS30_20725 [Pedobacter steynii]